MKKQWKEPKLVVQHFVPNEYVSACGTLDNGTVLYAANIEIVTAWERIPAGTENYIQDDILSNLRNVYRKETNLPGDIIIILKKYQIILKSDLS